ncbi:hypothetical protein [Bifidobacterium myosotis]|uniref:Uncharacterized protein n=1 Tax=Bifidobacterium myosotis TaxID=1630166 RepID=A0A5M9ZKY1_9BIFI|nr:hypothetical protein [Bifidobacterium myosotis]KAA8828178.1 hypothetical protein EMO91_06985 [Bifidobacterium myosotis]
MTARATRVADGVERFDIRPEHTFDGRTLSALHVASTPGVAVYVNGESGIELSDADARALAAWLDAHSAES